MSEPVAVGGFDVVAYQTEGRAVQGSAEHRDTWSGRVWQFASAENLEQFARDPERFAPQYGGKCAFAMSLGKDAHGSPKHWRTVDGRLFLQSNPVAALLFRLLPGRVKAADESWMDEQGHA